ncbi:peroxiredoxin family protein [Portibacter marinus]|uniref:peroxiredoxin family protein n=1 Tax=Portibacter marinus TaxID=2898660 RepID=UPI001F296171|nr:TlpA disulfide reductase family protein [Portibacter marinus]
MSGSQYDIDEIDSELLVMNFWNIGCRGCVQEMPFLNKIHTEMKDDPITFWSITLNHESNLTEYLAKHPIKWEIKGNVDFTGNFSKSQFDIKCMPTTIVINKEKEILYAKCGPILDDENGQRFVKLLRTGQPWE